MGAIRLVKEHSLLQERGPQELNNFVAQPDPNNLFVWHFMIFGLTDCVYENGYYIGTLTFPNNYPMAPPAIRFHTPNGRFALN